MSKNKKKKPENPLPQDEDTVECTTESRVEECKKKIIQQAILLFKRERSSIVDLDSATKEYLDEIGELKK